MEAIRIIEISDRKMVSSGIGMFGEEKFEHFEQWFSTIPRDIFPKDFLFWDNTTKEKEGFHWLYIYEDGLSVPAEFEIIDFTGGLYAVSTGIDQQTDMEAMTMEVDKFLAEHGFQRDLSRFQLGNSFTAPAAKEILGYDQMDYYTPIKKA
ncbi:hypothetical protein ACYSNR_06610 [Enterococcus sp. LJL128]|uniref:hypothetical protein n=1 Tax=Enterococcus sp. LJL51 TaxID=3416656 RepID=UPI003CF69A17